MAEAYYRARHTGAEMDDAIDNYALLKEAAQAAAASAGAAGEKAGEAAQSVAQAKEEADRAKGYADSLDPARFAKADSTYTKAETDRLAQEGRTQSYTVTVPAAGWAGTAAPYTNTVTVEGVEATTVLSDITLAPASVGAAGAQAAATAWTYLDTQAGKVVFYADSKPAADFTIICREVK